MDADYIPVSSASQNVYMATTLATGDKVIIKEIYLSQQPRMDLILNEIMVMKEALHPNIVSFLDSYFVKNNEVWVVTEYMEGCSLSEIIANNTFVEDQISRICLEVSCSVLLRLWLLMLYIVIRRVKVWDTCIVRISFIGISSLTMSCSTCMEGSKSVSSLSPFSRC